MFSTVLDCRQSLSEFSFCFLHMVTRSSARLHRPVRDSKDTNGFHPHISEGFDNYCEMIPRFLTVMVP